MSDKRFDRLFSPLQIRDFEIPNRIAVTGLGWTWAGVGEQQMLPTATLASFWSQRAAGGLGLIVSEPQSVHPTSTSTNRVIENSSDAVIEPYRLVTEAVHAHGTIIVGQLNHAGHLAGTAFHSLPLWAPSEVRAPMGTSFPAGGGVLPHVMSAAEISEVIAAFASAAARDIAAGFDGVEINAAEGYLLAQFLSPLTNRRDDEYGGSSDARMRLLLEVVQAVRAEIGAGPLLGVRIGTDDPIEGEFGEAAMREVASALAAGGGVDYLSTTPQHLPPMGHEPGAYSELAAAAREASGLPVLYLGWVDGPATGEGLLESGRCDMVGMSRATLADTELPNKARAGDLETIRPCVACNQSCQTVGSVCVLNPMLGAAELGIGNGRDASAARKVLVIGGGPAGAETACLLATEGHAVTVWEREPEVGGQLRVAARAPHRARLGTLADYYEGELARCKVTVEVGREATLDDIRAFGADLVVAATGAFGHRPVVPGVELPHVTDVRSILRGFVEPGEHVVVVLGRSEHRYQGLSVAEFVAAQGKTVHLVTDAFFAGDLWDQQSRIDTMRRLTQAGVTFSTMSELVAIRENEVAIRNRYSFAESQLTADTVVLAFGDDADSGLLAELEADGLEVVAVGDVVAPRDLQGAMRDATMLAQSV